MDLRLGDTVPQRTCEGADGVEYTIPDLDAKFTYLRFLRWSGCSICNLGLREFTVRSNEIARLGIRMFVFMHSSRGEVLHFHKHAPFVAIPDPGKRYFTAFGVGTSAFFFLRLSTPLTLFRSRREVANDLNTVHGPTGLPADFLLSQDGAVRALQYGHYADDSWTVDDLLAAAQEASRTAKLLT